MPRECDAGVRESFSSAQTGAEETQAQAFREAGTENQIPRQASPSPGPVVRRRRAGRNRWSHAGIGDIRPASAKRATYLLPPVKAGLLCSADPRLAQFFP